MRLRGDDLAYIVPEAQSTIASVPAPDSVGQWHPNVRIRMVGLEVLHPAADMATSKLTALLGGSVLVSLGPSRNSMNSINLPSGSHMGFVWQKNSGPVRSTALPSALVKPLLLKLSCLRKPREGFGGALPVADALGMQNEASDDKRRLDKKKLQHMDQAPSILCSCHVATMQKHGAGQGWKLAAKCSAGLGEGQPRLRAARRINVTGLFVCCCRAANGHRR